MDAISNILFNKNLDEPPEITAIKKYVHDTFKAEASVLVRDNDIIVTVKSAALAGSLRLKSDELKRRCQITKRVSFRIG